MTEIPWDKLGVPDTLRAAVEPEAPRQVRMAAAKGALPASGEALLGMLYVLACGADAEIRTTALDTLKGMPGLVEVLSQRTHAKVLELIANAYAPADNTAIRSPSSSASIRSCPRKSALSQIGPTIW